MILDEKTRHLKMTQSFVLVNPASAHGKTRRQWPQIALGLRKQLGDFEVGFTEYSGHGTVLTRAAITRGARHIVSVGGDGTHNEVVNGFFEADRLLAEDLCLSIIPAGTGGDLRRTLGLPVTPSRPSNGLVVTKNQSTSGV